MKLSTQDKRFFGFFLSGWFILEMLVVVFVGIRSNLTISDMLIAAGVIGSMTLLAVLITYLILREMKLL